MIVRILHQILAIGIKNIVINDGDHSKQAGKIVGNEFNKRKLVKFRNSFFFFFVCVCVFCSFV